LIELESVPIDFVIKLL